MISITLINSISVKFPSSRLASTFLFIMFSGRDPCAPCSDCFPESFRTAFAIKFSIVHIPSVYKEFQKTKKKNSYILIYIIIQKKGEVNTLNEKKTFFPFSAISGNGDSISCIAGSDILKETLPIPQRFIFRSFSGKNLMSSAAAEDAINPGRNKTTEIPATEN